MFAAGSNFNVYFFFFRTHDGTLLISGLRERSRFTYSSNVVAVIHMKSRGGRTWKEIGRTEILENTLDPEWSKTFLLDYYFEEKQVRKYQYLYFMHC